MERCIAATLLSVVARLHIDELSLIARVTVHVVLALLAAAGASMSNCLQLRSVMDRLNFDRGRYRHGSHLHVAIDLLLASVAA